MPKMEPKICSSDVSMETMFADADRKKCPNSQKLAGSCVSPETQATIQGMKPVKIIPLS